MKILKVLKIVFLVKPTGTKAWEIKIDALRIKPHLKR